ncbi:MAG: MFS transporter [Clostridia bacterium]
MSRVGLNRNLLLLTVALMLWGLGFGLYAVFWPLYVEHLGGGPAAIGLVTMIGGLATAAAVLPGGLWTDRGRAKPVLLWGWVVAIPAPLLFIGAKSWVWLIPGVILYFGSSFSTPAVQAYITAEAGRRLSVAYNVVMAAFALGAVVGPVLGGHLVTRIGYHGVFWLAAMLYALSTLALLPLTERPRRAAARLPTVARPLQNARLQPWLGIGILLAAAGALAGPYIVPFWRTYGGLSLQEIGLLGSLTTLAAAVASPLWGRVAERRGLAGPIALGLAAVAGGITLIWAFPRNPGVQMFSALERGTGAAAHGLVGVAVGRLAHAGQVGLAYAWMNALMELAGALAPYPGALLYQWRPSAPMLVTSLVFVLAAVMVATREPRAPPVSA